MILDYEKAYPNTMNKAISENYDTIDISQDDISDYQYELVKFMEIYARCAKYDLIHLKLNDLGPVLLSVAEEASEASKSAIKYLRTLGAGCPTPVTTEEALEDIKEEFSDTISTMLMVLYRLDILTDTALAHNEKSKRSTDRHIFAKYLKDHNLQQESCD